MKDYGNPPTRKQVDYACALGAELDSSTTRLEVSELIDEYQAMLGEPPNAGQTALAHSLGVSLAGAATSRIACDRLMHFLIARRWVYSVCRRQAAARWRFYPDSGLPEEAVQSMAHWFLAQPDYFDAIEQMTVGESTTGDVWFRLSDSICEDFEPYLATAAKVYETFGPDFAQAKLASKRAAHSTETGCVLMLLMIAAPAGAFLRWWAGS